MKKFKNFNITNNSKLEYDGTYYYLIVNTTIKEKKEKKQKHKIISIDPGVKTFATCYDPDGEIVIFNRNKDLINKLKQKIDDLKYYGKNNRYILKTHRKIKNIIDDVHWRMITYLMKNYNTIILPTFESQGMVNGSKRRQLNRELMILSHYKFRQRLNYKARMYENTAVIATTEEYTTKTCGKCGLLNDKIKLGDGIFYCKNCDLTMDRDYNAARNILIKTLYSNTKM